jgi:AcrR family transcriptional regulator
LYYHYDDRAGLVADFLDHLLDALADRLDVTGATPRATLERRLDRLLPSDPDPEATAFNRVILELRLGAARQPAVAEQFARNDELVRAALAEPIDRGVEADLFRDVDPHATATFLQSTALGATVRAVTLTDTEAFRRARWAVDAYVDGYLTR